MSTLQVANLHFESTGNNRLQYTGSNAYNLVAAGVTAATINSTAVAFPLNLSINNISSNTFSANGSTGTSGQVLLSGGASTNVYWGTTGGNYAMQVFTDTTPTGTTWTKPANLVAVKVTVVGGGAGVVASPSSQGGGGGGGSAIEYIPAPSIPGPVTVTVGAAGGTTSPTLTGGTSSFGAFCSATGGSGGSGGPSGGPGGAGGTGTGGTINFTGQNGGTSISSATIVQIPGPSTTQIKSSFAGNGGDSIFGGGGHGGGNTGDGPTGSVLPVGASSGYTYGGGASGKLSSGTGAAGFQGVVIIEEFY